MKRMAMIEGIFLGNYGSTITLVNDLDMPQELIS